MKSRIISGIAMLPLIVLVILGGYFLIGLTVVIAGVALYEFVRALKSINIKVALYESFVLLAILFAIVTFKLPAFLYMLWVVLSMMLLFGLLFIQDRYSLQDIFASLTSLMYVGFLSVHIILVDQIQPWNLIWFVIISAFGTDIGAYFAGYFLGKHKLCPNISPKKTIEGALGGVLSSMVFCLIAGVIIGEGIILHSVFIGLIASVFAQLGDLTASIFKRKIGIKDYGDLIPGHGGILDRVDSIIYTAPVVFYYMSILMVFNLI